MKVFLDTNVLIDVLAAREPFFKDSQRVLDYCEKHIGSGYVSVLTYCTVAYVLRKSVGRDRLIPMLRGLRHILTPLPATSKTLDWAIDSLCPDFEDAMQYECALAAEVDVIVTRDKFGFIGSKIPIETPSEFVARFV